MLTINKSAYRALISVSLIFAVLFVAVLGFKSVVARYRIGYDPQKIKCLPYTLYFLKLGKIPAPQIHYGEILVYTPRPGQMGKGAAFLGESIGKVVFGLPGDHFVVKGTQAYINGFPVGLKMDLFDKLRQKGMYPPGGFDKDLIIPGHKILLLGTMPRSYDGRYWGLVDDNQVVARAYPLY